MRAALLNSIGLMVLGAMLAGCSPNAALSPVAAVEAAPLSIPGIVPPAPAGPAPVALAYGGTHGRIDDLIAYYARYYALPERLVRAVVRRESNFNPNARNGPYWGLMQIHPVTARTMGYRGAPSGLLDPDTNLKFAVRYLAGAYLVSGGDAGRADALYQKGFYYVAKRKGMLDAAGLR